MPFDMDVDLGPGDIVLDGPPKKGHSTLPIFSPCLLWLNGCMYHDTTWYGGRPQPRRHCVRWGPSSIKNQDASCTEVNLGLGDVVLDGVVAPPRRLKGAQPPSFHFMSIVAKWLDG